MEEKERAVVEKEEALAEKEKEKERALAKKEKEIKTVQESQLCAICMDNKKNTVFYPCGHLCCCENCWEELKRSTKRCPICRNNIQSAKKAYFL